MLTNAKNKKKNPLTRAQSKLLSFSLQKLLGNGLIEEDNKPVKKETDVKEMVLKNALNAIILNN